MKPEPTRVADWEEGQCGFDEDGDIWMRLCLGALMIDSNKVRMSQGMTGVRLEETNPVATIDESARQVFVDYFARKGK